jgi:hypothetical protein
MLNKNDKLFYHLINYFYYYEEFNKDIFDSLFENYKIKNDIDSKGSTFIYDIIYYTIKFNYNKEQLLEWFLQKNVYINNYIDSNKNTLLHIIIYNINKKNYIKSIKYIKILINLGVDIFKKNLKNESFIDIMMNKILENKLEINIEKKFNLICFDKNKLLNEDKQNDKIINLINNKYKKSNEYNYCIKYIKKNYNSEKIIYKHIINFIELLKKEKLYYNKNNKIYFDINKLFVYILPNLL